MNGSTCPICGQNDNTQKISSVVVAGTSQTSSFGATTGRAGANFIAGNSTSVSWLAQRLTPRTITPGNISLTTFLLMYFGLAIVIAYFLQDQIADLDEWWAVAGLTFFLIPVGFVISLIPLFTIIAIYRYSRPVARMKWFNSATHLWNSYYCHRDDIAFDDWWGTAPEAFVTYCFAKRTDE
jgi:hypothetical protein